LITRNFPPLLGGMERLNKHLLEELASAWDVALCGPRGSAEFAPAGAEVREVAVRPLWRFLLVAAIYSLAGGWRRVPDVVIAGSGLSAPMAWFAARIRRARAVVYLHGLDIVAPSRLYRTLWLPIIRRFDLVFVNSANTSLLAQAAGVPGDRIVILHPGTSLPEPPAMSGHPPAFATPPGAKVLLSVGRLTRRKGLAEFVRFALPEIRGRIPDAVLVVIGDEARDALHGSRGSERERIQSAATAAGVADAVHFVGHCSDQALEQALYAADLHVFPVLSMPGDVEGFGMVAIEAAAHGLQTVAFSVGGVPDAISEPVSGRLVPQGDYAAFADAVVESLAIADRDETRAACREFATTMSWERFGRQLRDRLEALRQQH